MAVLTAPERHVDLAPIARSDADRAPDEDLAGLDLAALGRIASDRWDALESLGHRSHEAAYDVGLVLEAARKQCPKGRWLSWVDEALGIARRTAQRYIEFRELVGERAKLEELDPTWGIVEAIAQLKPKRAAHATAEPRVFPVSTPRDVHLEVLDAGDLPRSLLKKWGGAVDLVVTSWPYGLAKTSRGYVDYTEYDQWRRDAGRWVDQLRLMLAPGGRVCLVLPFDTRLGGTPRPMVAHTIVLFEERGFHYRQHHPWPKAETGQTSRSNARGSATPPLPTPNAPAAITGAEEVLVFHVGEWSLGRVAEPCDLEPDQALAWTNAYWHGIPGSDDSEYDCVFPLELAQRLIRLYSYPNKASGERTVVADFHVGSGTSAAAAMTLGRSFVGGDLNPHAYALATQRVQIAHAALAGVAAGA